MTVTKKHIVHKKKGLSTMAKSFIYILTPLIIGVAPFVSQIIIESMREKLELRRIEAQSVPTTKRENKSIEDDSGVIAGIIVDSTSIHNVMEAK